MLASGLTFATAAGIATAATFFPQEPGNARTRTATGILTEYGVGIGSGAFSIQTATGKTLNFAVGRNMMINGQLVQCTAPTYNCPNWPSTIVLGTSKVKVTYWDTVTDAGQPVKASSQIDSAK